MSNPQAEDVSKIERVVELAAAVDAAEANLARTQRLLKETKEWQDKCAARRGSTDAQIVSLPLPVMVLMAVVLFMVAFVFGTVNSN